MGCLWSSNGGPTEENSSTPRSSEEFLSADSGPTEEDFSSRSSEEFLSAGSGWTSKGNEILSASTEAAARSVGGPPWRQVNEGGVAIPGPTRHNWTNPGWVWNVDDYVHSNRSRPGSSHTKFGGGWAQEQLTNRNGGYRRGSEHTLDQRSRALLPTPDPSVLHCAPEELMISARGTVGKCSSPEPSDYLCSTSGQTGNAPGTIPAISSPQQTSTSGLTGNYERAASPGILSEQQTSTSGPTRISARATSRGISSQKSYLSKSL